MNGTTELLFSAQSFIMSGAVEINLVCGSRNPLIRSFFTEHSVILTVCKLSQEPFAPLFQFLHNNDPTPSSVPSSASLDVVQTLKVTKFASGLSSVGR